MSPLPLVDTSEEQLTIAGTALGITAAKLIDSATPANHLYKPFKLFYYTFISQVYR